MQLPRLALALAAVLPACAVDDTAPELSDIEQHDIGVTTPTHPPVSRTTASIVQEAVGDPTTATGQRRYFGISVVVIRDGVKSFHHFGEAVWGSGVKPTSDTLYAIGSVTKTMTSTLAARLDTESIVDLDDNLQYLVVPEYVSSLPLERRGITITQLATMHSGLARNPPGGELGYRTGTFAGDIGKLMDTLETCPSSGCTPPLTTTADGAYSNYGFAVLGEVLARHSGYGTFLGALRNKVLLPLDMLRTNTKANLTDPSCVVDTCAYDDYGDCTYRTSCNGTFSPNAAVGYHKSDAGIWLRESSPGSNDNIKVSSGTLWSTPSDMGTWLSYNLGLTGPTILNTARSKVHTIYTLDRMGLGWQKSLQSYGDVWKKSGALPDEEGAESASFTAYIAFIEGSDDGVVVLANSSANPGRIAFDILEDIAD